MVADSGTYDESTIMRRRKVAEAMLNDGVKPQKIEHWTQGLAQLARAGIGGYLTNQADEDKKAEDYRQTADLYKSAGLPPPTAPASSPSIFERMASAMGGSGESAPAAVPEMSPPMVSPAAAPQTPPAAPMAAQPAPSPMPVQPRPMGNKVAAALSGPMVSGPSTDATAPVPMARPEVMPSAKVWGDKEAEDAGLYEKPAPNTRIASAMSTPALPAAQPAPPPVATPETAGGIFSGVPRDKLPSLVAGLNSKNPTMKALAVQQLGNYTKSDAPTDETKEYKLAQSQGYKGSFIDFKTELKKAGATNVTTNVGGGSDKQIFDAMDEGAKGARATAQGLTGLREARAAIQGGAITGAGADARLALQKIGSMLGVADSNKIVNTETFRSAIAPQVAAVLKSTVGTANISNTDREFAEKAAGGNINLDEKSISRLLNIMEKASVGQIEAHQKRLDKVYGDPAKFDRERALFGVDMPAAIPAPVMPTAQPANEGWQDLGGGIRIREKK